MIYLVLQMAIFLILAALAGLVVGWWSNQLRHQSKGLQTDELPSEDDVFAIKRRLDKCFDDNARLRRDLKSTNNQFQKSTKSGDSQQVASSDGLNDKIEVLMDDLQLRDDTILALEKELEMARNVNR